jgi:hypothetical protein
MMLVLRVPGYVLVPPYPLNPPFVARVIIWIVIIVATVVLVQRGYDVAAAISVVATAGLAAREVSSNLAALPERP